MSLEALKVCGEIVGGLNTVNSLVQGVSNAITHPVEAAANPKFLQGLQEAIQTTREWLDSTEDHLHYLKQNNTDTSNAAA